MAVVAFLNGGDLFGTNNANATLASNIGTQGSQVQISGSANITNIAFTPTAGTLSGVVLAFNWSGQPTATAITVKLQFFNGSTWTDVTGTSVTPTSAQITRTCTTLYLANTVQGQFDYYFAFPTPAVVTALAGTWRFNVQASGGNPFLWTSDNTNIFYVAVSNTPTTFVTNQDQPIITNSSPVTFTQNVRFLGIATTGGTRGVCGFLGSGADGSLSNKKMLRCSTNNVSVTLNGIFAMCTFSAPEFGTDVAPLSGFVINYDTATVGTANRTGFMTLRADADSGSTLQKVSHFFYGTQPTVQNTYLTNNGLVGATSIEVEHTTGWTTGDIIDIGGQTTRGIGDTQAYTITSVSGKTINFSPALQAAGGTRMAGATGTLSIANPCVATWSSGRGHGLEVNDVVYFRTTGALPTGITAGQKYYVIATPTVNTFTFSDTMGGATVTTSGTQSGVHTICVGKYAGRVIRMNGYGMIWQTNVSGGVPVSLGAPATVKIVGVQVRDISIGFASDGGRDSEQIASWQSPHDIGYGSFEFTSSPVMPVPQFINTFTSPTIAGSSIHHIMARRGAILGSCSYTGGASGTLNIDDNICMKSGFSSGSGYNIGVAGMRLLMSRNHFEQSNIQFTYTIAASKLNDNRFWACSTSVGFNRFNTVVFSEFNRNIYDNNANGISLVSTAVSTIGKKQIFGPLIQNSTDINFLAGFIQYEEADCKTVLVPDTGTNSIYNCVEGSCYIQANYQGAGVQKNDNRVYCKYGNLVATGYGLTDTTAYNGSSFGVATVGQYGFRLEPINGSNALIYSDNNGSTTIGNCQNLPVVVICRLNINNAAFYAGTHIKPTLRVRYDESTVVQTVATGATGLQTLQLVFTPTTSREDITIEILCATDATGTNRYVYLGELLKLIPEGVVVDTTRFGSYSHGLPLGTSRTFPSPSSIWDEQTAVHTLAGSYGLQANKTKRIVTTLQ